MRKSLLLRRVIGKSMHPVLCEGQVVLATGWYNNLRPGDVVLLTHQGMEKIKRIQELKDGRIYLVGDNVAASTDSRHFGWLPRSVVTGRLLWPRLPAKTAIAMNSDAST